MPNYSYYSVEKVDELKKKMLKLISSFSKKLAELEEKGKEGKQIGKEDLIEAIEALKESKTAIGYISEIIELFAKDWTEENEYLREICRKYYPDEIVDGNSYGVPAAFELADMLDNKINGLLANSKTTGSGC